MVDDEEGRYRIGHLEGVFQDLLDTEVREAGFARKRAMRPLKQVSRLAADGPTRKSRMPA